ncbi:MAG: hypothetical protein AAGI11_04815 [Pseudomonadota bacterium]
MDVARLNRACGPIFHLVKFGNYALLSKHSNNARLTVVRTNNSIRLFMPALAAILVALPIRADVLNVFSNGTAADANEVNQNFSDLNMRLDSLENSTTATVSANCTLEAPEALQDAIDAAPAHGLVINASGLCNSVTIFSKRNITINGPVQFISDGAGEAGRPLNIALSQSIFINDATADAVTGNERAVNVGASSVFFNNLVAKNSTDRDMSVNSKAVVFISGTSQIGDNNNLAPAGIELTEDSYISAGEDLTIKGTIGMFLRDGSLFAQDAAGSDANDLVIEGGAVVEGNSVLKLQNGSLNSFLFVGDSNAQVFVEGTQEFDLINAVVTADNGSITLNSAVTGGLASL